MFSGVKCLCEAHNTLIINSVDNSLSFVTNDPIYNVYLMWNYSQCGPGAKDDCSLLSSIFHEHTLTEPEALTLKCSVLFFELHFCTEYLPTQCQSHGVLWTQKHKKYLWFWKLLVSKILNRQITSIKMR